MGRKKEVDELLEELMSLTTEQLNARFIVAKQNEEAGKRQKKENLEIKTLSEKIKNYRKENETDAIKNAKEKIKEEKKRIDSEISHDILNLKALNEGENNLIKGFKKEQKIILKLIKERKFN